MKKNGFTLAEVLITLGIIGVISALTLPSLLNDTQGAQVGPKLGKAAAMFEQANQVLLQEYNSDRLSDAGLWISRDQNAAIRYGNELSKYLKISRYNGTPYSVPTTQSFAVTISSNNSSWLSKDGVIYYIRFMDSVTLYNKRHIALVAVDINGSASPNLPGTDVFAFSLVDDGSLYPLGSVNSRPDGQWGYSWRDYCKNDETPTNNAYYSCTASIFENNMKVMYKMR